MEANPSEIDAFYSRLKIELNNSNTWPAEYLFKFIIPTEEENINKIENLFDNLGAIIKTTASKTGKFTSVSIDVNMASAEEIIQKYQDVATIKGIISL